MNRISFLRAQFSNFWITKKKRPCPRLGRYDLSPGANPACLKVQDGYVYYYLYFQWKIEVLDEWYSLHILKIWKIFCRLKRIVTYQSCFFYKNWKFYKVSNTVFAFSGRWITNFPRKSCSRSQKFRPLMGAWPYVEFEGWSVWPQKRPTHFEKCPQWY